MRILALVSMLSLGALPLQAQRVRPLVTFPGLTAPVMLDTAGFPVRIAAPPGKIFAQLRAEYKEIDVPLSVEDSLTGMIGNLHVMKIRTLGKTQLSRYLNCGGGMVGPLADNARVNLALVSMLKSISADTTEVRTVLVGAATSLEGALRDAVNCSSSGLLELRMHNDVAKKLGVAKPQD